MSDGLTDRRSGEPEDTLRRVPRCVVGKRELTEREIINWCYAKIKEGIAARQDPAFGPSPYPGNTLAHMLSAEGWLREDLRIALMNAKPSYLWGQATHDAYARKLYEERTAGGPSFQNMLDQNTLEVVAQRLEKEAGQFEGRARNELQRLAGVVRRLSDPSVPSRG